MRRQSRQAGFSISGVVIAVVAIAAIGTAGWFVYQHNRVKPTSTTGSTQTNNQHNTSNSTNNNTQSQDVYANWKTYCDTTGHYCFRYPNDWTIEANTDQVTVLNSAKDVEVDYINLYAHDSGLLTFTPVSVTDFTLSGTSLKIVGGVYSPANEPDYGVVDPSLLTTYPLTVGQSTSFPNALRFTDAHASNSSSIAFRARATSPMSSESAAQAWFATTDAKTSLQILQSLYYQQ